MATASTPDKQWKLQQIFHAIFAQQTLQPTILRCHITDQDKLGLFPAAILLTIHSFCDTALLPDTSHLTTHLKDSACCVVCHKPVNWAAEVKELITMNEPAKLIQNTDTEVLY